LPDALRMGERPAGDRCGKDVDANDALAGIDCRKKNDPVFTSQYLTFQFPERDAMPIATLRFTLPDEQADYDAARLGRQMVATIWEIDQRLRSLLKHGEPSGETGQLAEEIRQMIRNGCPDALEL
jgi:hypothetical protein